MLVLFLTTLAVIVYEVGCRKLICHNFTYFCIY